MCLFLDSFEKLPFFKIENFKNYPSRLDKIDIFENYRSNYADITYSQPLQIACVDVEAAWIKIMVLSHNLTRFQALYLAF